MTILNKCSHHSYNIVRYKFGFTGPPNAVCFMSTLYANVTWIKETNDIFAIEKYKRCSTQIGDKTWLKIIQDSIRCESNLIFNCIYSQYSEFKLARCMNNIMSKMNKKTIIPKNVREKIIASVKAQYATDQDSGKTITEELASDTISNEDCFINTRKKHLHNTEDSIVCGNGHKKRKVAGTPSTEDQNVSSNIERSGTAILETDGDVCLSDPNYLCELPFANSSILFTDQLKG